MTDEQIALSRRAVACKRWRWMEGMRTVHNPEYGVSGVPQTWVLPVSDGGLVDVGQHYQRRGQFPSALGQCVPGGGLGTRLPDLQDPATLGCLLALVREAWGEKVVIRIGTGWWEIEAERFISDDTCAVSLAESLVAALEAAP
jgi:hypothetical protein